MAATTNSHSRKKRKDLVTEDRIEKALIKVAGFAASDPSLLPVFVKLESELEAKRTQKSALCRALAIVESGARKVTHNASGLSNAAV